MPARTRVQPYPIVAWLDRRTRRQRWIGGLVLGLVVLGLLVQLAAQTILDRWWYASVTSAPVWSTRVTAQLLLALAAMVVSGLVLISSTLVALRTPPAPDNGPNRLVRRYRDRMGPAHRWLLVGVAVLLTLRIGSAALDQWQPWVLFLHGPDLGVRAPEVGWDLGYHLFRLPFLALVSSWLRQLLLVALGLAVYGYLASGALRLPRGGRRSNPRVLRHVAVLVAALALVQAASYVFVSWPATATDRSGPFDGVGWTIVHVVLPGLAVLAVVALLTGWIGIWTARTRRWRPLAWAVGTWALLQVVVLSVLPAVVQQVVVRPAEAARELPYIAHNLEATRDAYRLDAVEDVTVEFADGIDGAPTDAQADDLDRMPLFSEDQLARPLQVLVGTTATRISDVDLDRYEIDGVRRPVLLATRNVNRADLPERGWVNTHLVYTHGDGVVALPADEPAPDGRPAVASAAADLGLERPELYFGEGLDDWYAIVGTQRREFGGTAFDADTGIPLDSAFRRAVLALTVGQFEPFVSAELTDDSQLLFRRSVRERLDALAPFLRFDGNAYPVVTGGRVTWVIDGYTTASTYPHAQFARRTAVPDRSGLAGGGYNYLHASVKATVDAYDGSVHLYRTEVGGADDPILDAWMEIFPGLVEPIDQMPDDLRAHLLYPQDLLTVQTAMLGRYHVEDAETLFNGSDSWAISAAPGDGVARGNDQERTTGPSMAVSLFMPGEGELGGHWVAIRPYGPGAADKPTSTRDIMTGIAVADHDDPERLRLVRFADSPGRPVASPLVAQSAIDTDGDLASLFTLLNANGSAVQFGPMTPLPLDGAMVWARPIIVTGTADTTTPRLYGVAAVSNGLVGVGDEVAPALTHLDVDPDLSDATAPTQEDSSSAS